MRIKIIAAALLVLVIGAAGILYSRAQNSDDTAVIEAIEPENTDVVPSDNLDQEETAPEEIQEYEPIPDDEGTVAPPNDHEETETIEEEPFGDPI